MPPLITVSHAILLPHSHALCLFEYYRFYCMRREAMMITQRETKTFRPHVCVVNVVNQLPDLTWQLLFPS